MNIKVKKHSTDECKPLSQCEIDAIIQLRKGFNEPVQSLRSILQACDDGCPMVTITKV